MRKYREEIEKYIDDHRDEMVEDIIRLCSINSQRSEYVEGAPFGEGPKRALTLALNLAEKYGFEITNYDNYVGAVDLNDREKESLKSQGIELSATAKEDLVIQRYYLYMNMTKSFEYLSVSYSSLDNLGKSLKPSYIIAMLAGLFTDVKVENAAKLLKIYSKEGLKEAFIRDITALKKGEFELEDESLKDIELRSIYKLTDKKLFYEYQTFYLCMQDKVEEYRVFLITVKNKELDWNYQQKDFTSADKFYEWIADAKKVALIYDTDLKPKFNDDFVTIQTCLDAYSSKRVILLAVKIREYTMENDSF